METPFRFKKYDLVEAANCLLPDLIGVVVDGRNAGGMVFYDVSFPSRFSTHVVTRVGVPSHQLSRAFLPGVKVLIPSLFEGVGVIIHRKRKKHEITVYASGEVYRASLRGVQHYMEEMPIEE